MKKKILILLVLLVAASAVVFAQITRDEAEAIAIKDSGIPASSVEYMRSSLDWEHGERVYDVEFYADGVEYDYEIALSDGKILSFDSEAERIRHTRSSDELSRNDALLLALGNAGYSEDEVGRIKVEKDWDDGYAVYEIEFRTSDYEYEYEISGEAEILSYSIEKRGRVRTERDAAIMDRSEAEGVITSYLPEGVEIMRFERDYDDGRWEYEVEFYSGNTEYDYEIQASDGSILSSETENRVQVQSNSQNGSDDAVGQNGQNAQNNGQDDGQNAQNNQGQTNTQTGNANVAVTREQAIETALSRVSGATEQDIRIELDRDDGVYKYEGDIIYNGMEYEFEIDANSGTILEWSEERF